MFHCTCQGVSWTGQISFPGQALVLVMSQHQTAHAKHRLLGSTLTLDEGDEAIDLSLKELSGIAWLATHFLS